MTDVSPTPEDVAAQVVVPPAFRAAQIKDVSSWYYRAWHHRYRMQTWLGVILTAVILLDLTVVIVTACYMAWTGKAKDVSTFVQPIQALILPTLGAAVGYAFGIKAGDKPSGSSPDGEATDL